MLRGASGIEQGAGVLASEKRAKYFLPNGNGAFMYWIMNTSTDPAFNLALEEHFLHTVKAGHPGYAILWQNSPAIVVGRFQNTRQEISPDFVCEHGITVVRRMTGGGAVYHDGGTLNYTFIHHLGRDGILPSFRDAGRPIAEALHSLGIPVVFSGRNDLVLEGAKVAGVAHCRQGSRFLHHGCILVDSNLDVLTRALHVDPEKFHSKGVSSVRSRVTNLADWAAQRDPSAPRLSVDRVRQAIMAYRSGPILELSREDVACISALRDSKYSSWDWTYGASPPFTEHRRKRFPWGTVEVFFDVQKGHIRSCRINGDFFMATSEETFGEKDGVCLLERRLTGIPYAEESIMSVLSGIPLERLFYGCNPDELKIFLAKG